MVDNFVVYISKIGNGYYRASGHANGHTIIRDFGAGQRWRETVIAIVRSWFWVMENLGTEQARRLDQDDWHHVRDMKIPPASSLEYPVVAL